MGPVPQPFTRVKKSRTMKDREGYCNQRRFKGSVSLSVFSVECKGFRETPVPSRDPSPLLTGRVAPL